MSTEQLLEKIRSRGYWRVNIRPTEYQKRRLGGLSDVRAVVESCKVSFRGWDYPFWEEAELRNEGEFVECTVDWDRHFEYVRFYRSGQFLHLFSPWEEGVDPQELFKNRSPRPTLRAGYLSVIGVVYLATEIFEFAARLASKGLLLPKASVSVQLFNMNDHQLEMFSASRILFHEYVRTSANPIVFEREVTEDDLISNTDALALDLAIEVFENFNWDSPPRQVFAEDQRRLRERRL